MSIVLVTGAAGFLGSHLVQRLRADGHEVRALVQSAAQASGVPTGVAHHIGDVTLADTLCAPLQDVETVFHCAARLPGRASEAEIWHANVDGTRILLAACVAAGVTRLVFMSTDSVYGDGHQRAADEHTPLAPDYLFEDNYPRSKAVGEQLVREAGATQGLCVSILRTCMIYGPGASTGSEFLRWWAAKRVHLLVGSGRARLSMVFVTDLVEAMLLAASSPQAVGQTYNVASGAYMVRDILETSARITGKAKLLLNLPPAPTRFVCQLLQPIAAWVSAAAARRLEPRRVDFLINDHVMDCAKAERELGFRPRVDLAQGLALTLA